MSGSAKRWIGSLTVALPLILLAGTISGRANGDLRVVQAVKNQDKELIRSLLAQSVDVNVREGDGTTPLHWAAYLDDLDSASQLLKAGANANAANDLGITPLALAAVNGSASMVKSLLASKANPNVVSASGVSPLMMAARTGNLDVVKALLAAGADVNVKETFQRQTALMWAVAQRRAEVVSTLIEFGADVHARTKVYPLRILTGGPENLEWTEMGGSTPLLMATRVGDIASAKALLAAGADVNAAAPDGATPLVRAAHSGHGPLAVFLLENGAKPNAAGSGYTALHAAVLIGDLQLVKALLTRSANAAAQVTKGTRMRRAEEDLSLPSDLIGATPFFLAAKYAEPEIMRTLEAAGADPLTPLPDGTTPLMAAAGLGWNGSTNRHGVDIVRVRAGGLAPDDPEADDARALEAVKVALELGGDVNAVNADGETAVFGAAPRHLENVVRFLVARGASLEAKNKRGDTIVAMLAPGRNDSGVSPTHRARMQALLRELSAKQ